MIKWKIELYESSFATKNQVDNWALLYQEPVNRFCQDIVQKKKNFQK